MVENKIEELYKLLARAKVNINKVYCIESELDNAQHGFFLYKSDGTKIAMYEKSRNRWEHPPSPIKPDTPPTGLQLLSSLPNEKQLGYLNIRCKVGVKIKIGITMNPRYRD
ncbi:hypothetical protein [Pragia fontium]|uniref:hypothetical protein n=1 Tax=Pragia fontium TaxID=82985 RepID=UPI00064A45B1|nr:hypothetical protein [Pragia fontium]AKJ41539.1 hypothetical protein QQ39_05125 [Pragia fontium]